ncbi:hypothetical protein BaRGS_00015837 [Batillaria attramentaria]|uniref:Uncharacterized protein n=1 Tax=Batillaria attramentaria TaxID=370345 RepID=A0ABD0L090_9CAEN
MCTNCRTTDLKSSCECCERATGMEVQEKSDMSHISHVMCRCVNWVCVQSESGEEEAHLTVNVFGCKTAVLW